MDIMDFTQAAARIKVLETRLLSRTKIERMVDAKDVEEVIKILGETEYSNAIGEHNKVEEYEKILSAELNRVYKLMYEMSREKIVVDILALKYDYHNLKVLIKEKILQKNLKNLYIAISTIDFPKLRQDYLDNNLGDIDERFNKILENVRKDFEINSDPQRIDILLDRYYFDHLYELAKKADIPLFINYVQNLIDFTNIKSLIRIKKQNKGADFLEEVILCNGKIEKNNIILQANNSLQDILEKFKNYDISLQLKSGLEFYQQSESLSEFEKQCDNYLMGLNKPSKYINFGPEPIFSYIVAKETEVKVLRIIIVSKLNKLSPNNIRERLRDLYV